SRPRPGQDPCDRCDRYRPQRWAGESRSRIHRRTGSGHEGLRPAWFQHASPPSELRQRHASRLARLFPDGPRTQDGRRIHRRRWLKAFTTWPLRFARIAARTFRRKLALAPNVARTKKRAGPSAHTPNDWVFPTTNSITTNS